MIKKGVKKSNLSIKSCWNNQASSLNNKETHKEQRNTLHIFILTISVSI